MGTSFLPPFLRTLCFNSPWNYAVFWKLKHQDETLLAWEDGFCHIFNARGATGSSTEDFYFNNSNKIVSSNPSSSLYNGTPGDYLVGLAVAEMSNASHVVGKGVVGEAALTGNVRWIYSDSIETDVLNSILIPEYPEEWLLQFAAGIKTIFLLPVIPDGVLQLGSVETVAEDAAFIDYVKNKFDAYKETNEHDRRCSIEPFSLMSTFMNDLEEPSTVTSEQLIEDESSIHAVTSNYYNFIASQMVPKLMFQNLYNASENHVTDPPGNVAESESSRQPLGMIHAAEPCQLSCEDYEIDIFKYYHHEKLRPSYCDEVDSRTCGDIMNVVMDFPFEDSVNDPTLVGNNFNSAICRNGSSFSGFLGDQELHRTHGEDKAHRYTFGTYIPGQDVVCPSIGDIEPSYTMDMQGLESVEFSVKEVEMEQLLEAAVANAYSRSYDNSSDKSNVTSVYTSSGNLSLSKSRGQSEHCTSMNEDKISSTFFTSEFIAPELDTKSSFRTSVSSMESKISSLSDKLRKRKRHDSLSSERLSTTNKRRPYSGDNQRPRPRDRQLIQDRIKELRELVPNTEKCSIDGLLDKTIKHMLFLRSVTNQADKLRNPTLEEEADEKSTKRAEVNCSYQNGTSWAVEVGSEPQLCPIIVKDLDLTGHMLIEMLCTDHGRFLEIADVIRRFQLTILKGVMEESNDNSWASFIVQTSGSFHRLDIFWPLMKLLQQSRPPVSSKM